LETAIADACDDLVTEFRAHAGKEAEAARVMADAKLATYRDRLAKLESARAETIAWRGYAVFLARLAEGATDVRYQAAGPPLQLSTQSGPTTPAKTVFDALARDFEPIVSTRAVVDLLRVAEPARENVA
jgi:hypothetical protein